MMFARALALVSVCCLLAGGARAQTPNGQQEMVKMMHRAAYNQLGVLEYCLGNGDIDQSIVDTQRKALEMLPPTQVDGLDQAEATGKKGVVSINGTEVSLADSAKAQNTTSSALCKQIANLIKSQAANLPK